MNSNDIIHMAREAGIDAHIKVGAAELERFAALVADAALKQAEADHLKLHAIEELCQLGYTVKDGELFPPDHLHKLIEAAGHPLAASTQDEPAQQPAALKAIPEAMNTVITAMQADPGYAWSWHCNVAMAFVDAGGDPYIANQGAARFMRLLANVEPAYELPTAPPKAEAVPGHTLPYERALVELIEKVAPGLDSGDVLADAATASAAISPQQADSVPKWLTYDPATDVLTIHGKRYSAGMFGEEGFLAPPGTLLRVEAGAPDVVTLTKLWQPSPPICPTCDDIGFCIKPSECAKEIERMQGGDL